MLSALLRAGRSLTAGLSCLSTADSILMSYQKSTHGGVEALVALTQIGAFWVKISCLNARYCHVHTPRGIASFPSIDPDYLYSG